VELLCRDFDVHVVAPTTLLDVDLLRETAHLYRGRGFTANSRGNRVYRAVRTPQRYLAIREILDDIKPDVIIFNSTYSILEVALICLIFRRNKKIQIIHNFQNFLTPCGHRLYRYFDGNLVISEQVHRYVATNHPQFGDLGFFLPIFFDSFLAAANCRGDQPDSSGPLLKVGVFGSIESTRRNYLGLLAAVEKLGPATDPTGLRLYLVGKASREIEQRIKERNLACAVRYFTEFVPFREMFALLFEVDIVLFLIDHSVRHARVYNLYKISGTSTLMKAFRKAGASSSEFQIDTSLADKCFYYSGADIDSLLRALSDGSVTRDDIQKKTATYEGQRLFSFEEQQARLVSMIQRVIES